jgi:hypothetical protein
MTNGAMTKSLFLFATIGSLSIPLVAQADEYTLSCTGNRSGFGQSGVHNYGTVEFIVTIDLSRMKYYQDKPLYGDKDRVADIADVSDNYITLVNKPIDGQRRVSFLERINRISGKYEYQLESSDGSGQTTNGTCRRISTVPIPAPRF